MSTLPTAEAEAGETMIGRELPPFRVVAELGRGAMGRVYAGEHGVLGRRVAIKVLEPQFASDPDSVARFIEEARAVNGIRHPNIVDITDFAEVDGRPYYVMELLDGETLSARILRCGRLDPVSAVRVGMQVASALAAAHDHGVIHRDVKPDNIFLCNHPDYPDRVKVLDFGVAKLIRRDDAADAPGRTQAGTLVGTPLYMSPEQSLGRPIDNRSDVYALGVVLFEALTGVPPFDHDSYTEVLMAHVVEPPPSLRSLSPAIPEELETIVLRTLAKLPGDRYNDMRSLRAALVAFEVRSNAAATSPQRPAALAAVTAIEARAPTLAHGTSAPAPVAPVATPVAAAAPAALALPLLGRALAGAPQAKTSSYVADTLLRIILERIEEGRLVLPAIPQSVSAALSALGETGVNMGRVARLLNQDPLLAPQLLRVASSAAHATGRKPDNMLQVVMQLGVVRLRSLLLELSARRVFDSPRARVKDAFRGLWLHSNMVAVMAREVNQVLGKPVDPDTVHLGGLLHDVGKPLIGVMLLEAEKTLGRAFQLDQATWLDVVARSHRVIGIELARSWNLGDELSALIAGSAAYEGSKANQIVCFANALAKLAGKTVGPIDEEAVETTVAEGADLLSLDWRFVHDLRSRADELERALEH